MPNPILRRSRVKKAKENNLEGDLTETNQGHYQASFEGAYKVNTK
jgi:hypothetical protein